MLFSKSKKVVTPKRFDIKSIPKFYKFGKSWKKVDGIKIRLGRNYSQNVEIYGKKFDNIDVILFHQQPTWATFEILDYWDLYINGKNLQRFPNRKDILNLADTFIESNGYGKQEEFLQRFDSIMFGILENVFHEKTAF